MFAPTASRLCLSLLIAAVVAALPASAGNSTFLATAPVGKFTEQDMKVFRQTLDEVLNSAADGTARSWSNPATKASGEIKALKSFERDAMPCRRVKIRNSAKGLSGAGQYTLCKSPTGEWLPAS